MKDNSRDEVRFPLLEQMSRDVGMPIKPAYKTSDLARLFDVKPRTIQQWVRDDRIRSVRDLPGHNRFLPHDVEEFLRGSERKRNGKGSHEGENDENQKNKNTR